MDCCGSAQGGGGAHLIFSVSRDAMSLTWIFASLSWAMILEAHETLGFQTELPIEIELNWIADSGPGGSDPVEPPKYYKHGRYTPNPRPMLGL